MELAEDIGFIVSRFRDFKTKFPVLCVLCILVDMHVFTLNKSMMCARLGA